MAIPQRPTLCTARRRLRWTSGSARRWTAARACLTSLSLTGGSTTVSYRERLERWFGHLPLEVDDLFLLERFQLLALPSRAPLPALGATLAADPRLRRFLVARCPELEPWLGALVDGLDRPTVDLEQRRRTLVWELADWLVYQRFPEAYDQIEELRWGTDQLGEICELEGRTVVDAGSGTGWLSVELARVADTVFAVEPVTRLREYIRGRAREVGLNNLYPLDGFLHRVPLPVDSVDVLVTSRAIGWELGAELTEIERVVSPGGWAVHFVGTPCDAPRTMVDDTLESRGYTPSRYRDGGGWRRRYTKRMS
ncbi:MAG: class I SAM-dependent methyltransferase [Myxococcales bacterium FL481]|nr:MAG: class I SAM-dependent methyltransferase [Myxococcales bacterium FL481]